jgi:translation elongation factor EF-1beta
MQAVYTSLLEALHENPDNKEYIPGLIIENDAVCSAALKLLDNCLCADTDTLRFKPAVEKMRAFIDGDDNENITSTDLMAFDKLTEASPDVRVRELAQDIINYVMNEYEILDVNGEKIVIEVQIGDGDVDVDDVKSTKGEIDETDEVNNVDDVRSTEVTLEELSLPAEE